MTSLFSRAIAFLEVPRPEGASSADMRLQNKDLLPVPEGERLWKARHYWSFWLADSFNLGTFMIASGMLAQGLSVWQAWACVWVGYGVAAIFLVLNAIPGARHHIIFPAYLRASWGPVGSLWPVFNRAAMACVWYGVQAVIGGDCVFTLITAMAPSFATLPNGIPNSGTDTAHLISFLLFSGGSLIVLWFPLHSIRHLFTVKAIVAPIGGLALFGWCMAKAGGTGPLLNQGATKSGSAFGWAFVAQMMSCLGNMATLITNATDFASRADKPSAVVVPQLVALPFTFAIVSLFGILIGSSSVVIFDEFVWSPNEIMARFLQDSPSAGDRAGVFFISAAFILAQLGTNVAANSISAGCDLTALFPRFISIRRGGYVAAFVGLVMCPWNLLKDSNSFTSYLSAYSVFLSSIIGVMVANYWVVSSLKVKVDDLYTMSIDGRYRYWKGINLRAYGAYFAGLAINLPGLIGAVGGTVPIAATHIYELSFFTGFGVSFIVFVALNKLFPVEQPSREECELITVGTAAWGVENPVWDESSETKSLEKESETSTGVVPVRV